MNPHPATPSARWALVKRLVIGRDPRRTVARALVLVAVSFVLFKFVLLPVRIQGGSMAPTYRDGSINFVNRLAYRWGKPKRGDVVAVKTTGFHNLFLKRIVGLPGETVAVQKGVVWVNGQPLAEPYVKDREPWDVPPVTLNADEYLLIGDNRSMPEHLHTYGTVPAAKLVGKVLW